MKFLEMKIPPPIYGLLTGICIWLLDKQFPLLDVLPAVVQTTGLGFIFLGFGLDLVALGQFYFNRTTPNPLSPQKAKTIVVSGLYKYTRNPMYLGLLITLIGWTFFLGNIVGLICIPLFMWVINSMQIHPEEKILSKLFGTSYTDYLRRVRRWL